jgi:Fe-S-cluster containining protein
MCVQLFCDAFAKCPFIQRDRIYSTRSNACSWCVTVIIVGAEAGCELLYNTGNEITGSHMSTLRGPKTASSTDFIKKSRDADVDIVDTIKGKLREKRVKVATIVAYCENVDRNGDYLIHKNDLQSILNHALGSESVTQREMQHLERLVSSGRKDEPGLVNYRKFLDLFSDSLNRSREPSAREHWDYDDDEDSTPRWAAKKGSVGEWLTKAACPAEVDNFRKLIACLEEYERASGMKCIQKENGFVVPMGPDLKASISFYMD